MKVQKSESSNKKRFEERKLSRGTSFSSGKRGRESQIESVQGSTTRGRRQGSTVVSSTGRGMSTEQEEVLEGPHCHRRNLGVCRILTGGCFRCGSTDNFIANYPKESGDSRSMQGSGRGRSIAPPST